jgi:hypothetical protein
MPIEIREVVIKTTMIDDRSLNPEIEEIKRQLRQLKKEVVEECLDEIWEQIENDSDR